MLLFFGLRRPIISKFDACDRDEHIPQVPGEPIPRVPGDPIPQVPGEPIPQVPGEQRKHGPESCSDPCSPESVAVTAMAAEEKNEETECDRA